MFEANRAIVIRKAHDTNIKSIIPIENAEEYLLNRIGDILLIHDGLGHKVVTDGEFEKTYEVVRTKAPWMDVILKSEEKDTENGYAQVKRGGLQWGKDRDFIPKAENVEENPNQTYGKTVRTTHHKTDMLALEITEANYSIAAALLPQNFTTIDPKEVVGYFAIINDRMVSIDDRGVSIAVGLNNWACHPDIFHDIFVAVDFAYGDFLYCYREGK